MADTQYKATLIPQGAYGYYTIKCVGYNVDLIAPNNRYRLSHEANFCAVYNGLTSNTVSISQEDSDYLFYCDPEEIECISIGETIIIGITSVTNDENVIYRVKEKPEWVTNEKFLINDDQQFQFDVEQNSNSSARQGNIILIQNESNLELTIQVSQKANDGSNDILKSSLLLIEFSDNALSTDVSLCLVINGKKINTTDIELVSTPSGIIAGEKRIGSGTYNNSPSMIQTFKCDDKNTCSGNIVYKYGSLTCTIPVKFVEKKKFYFITADPKTIILNKNGGEEYKYTIAVSTNDKDWTYIYNGSYYTVSKIDKSTLTVYCKYDNDGNPHSEEIILKCSSDNTITCSINVSQNVDQGGDVYVLTIEPSEFEFALTGGSKTIRITSTKNDVATEWSIEPSSSSYYTITTSDNSLLITCPSNTSETDTHLQTFTISNANLTKTLTIYQKNNVADDIMEIWRGDVDKYNNLIELDSNTVYIVELPKYEKDETKVYSSSTSVATSCEGTTKVTTTTYHYFSGESVTNLVEYDSTSKEVREENSVECGYVEPSEESNYSFNVFTWNIAGITEWQTGFTDDVSEMTYLESKETISVLREELETVDFAFIQEAPKNLKSNTTTTTEAAEYIFKDYNYYLDASAGGTRGYLPIPTKDTVLEHGYYQFTNQYNIQTRRLHYIKKKINNINFLLVNIHFCPEDADIRMKQIQECIDFINSKKNDGVICKHIIIGGDTNAFAIASRPQLTEGVNDATAAEKLFTDDGYSISRRYLSSIDKIIYKGNGLSIVSSKPKYADRADLSDHTMWYVTFKLNA